MNENLTDDEKLENVRVEDLSLPAEFEDGNTKKAEQQIAINRRICKYLISSLWEDLGSEKVEELKIIFTTFEI